MRNGNHAKFHFKGLILPAKTPSFLQVCVTCYDFGAHGNIFLEVLSPETNYWYNLTKYQESDSTWLNYSTIPIDEDGYGTNKDKLADHWEELMLLDTHCPDTITTIQQIQPTQNLDSYLPGFLPLQLGDQLTTFEEYRGFYCRGVHTRTSPWQRDFFIYSDLDSSALNTGIGYADQIGPGLGHWIDFNEMQSYSPPYPNHPLAVEARSINWYNDRIDSSTLCPCAILLKNPFFYPSKDSLTLGRTWFYGDSAEYYHVPNNTTMGYIWPKRIRYQTPPRYDTTSVDLPVDSLWQNYVSGHEIGHMINMPHSSSDSSIMGTHIANPYNPPHVYEQADLDYFLVKPPQP